MKILAVTNLYPTSHNPVNGIFVQQQIESLRERGLNVDLFHVDRLREGMKAYYRFLRPLEERIAQFHPDLIHVTYGGVLADRSTRLVRGYPIVVSFCGSDLHGNPEERFLRRTMSRWGVWASHRAARRADAILVKSQGLLDVLPADINRSLVSIVPNGVNLKLFQPLDRWNCRSRLGWRSEGFHVLFPASKANRNKRPELAEAAVSALSRQGLDTELHELRGVAHTDVPLWINAADVVLLTSEHEGSPNVIKETLACNVPIVSVDVGDVKEMLAGVAGCYVAADTPVELADKLAQVHSGPRTTSGRERAKQVSLEAIAERIHSIYHHVLAEKSAAV